MTLHSLVLISDSFSCNCNSIQSPVSIVHLRVNLILSHLLLRLYISYSISNANQFSSTLCSNVSRSTRINSSSVHTYIFRLFYLRVILQGFVTQNATWCRNRGCICISSIRRTYGRIHSSFLHPAYIQTSTIILWTELFPKKRREKIQGEILQVQWCFHIPTRTTVFLHAIQQLQVILHTELILLQESPRNTTTTRLIPCRLLPATVPRVSRHSTRQNKASGPPTAFQGHTAQAGFQ